MAANDDERRIVETLLLVARYEAGESSTVRERVPCGELVTAVVEEFQPVREIKGVELRAEVRPHSLVTLGDPHEIRRAIDQSGRQRAGRDAAGRSRRDALRRATR